jgi:flagellar hook-basal body complex protein FliE
MPSFIPEIGNTDAGSVQQRTAAVQDESRQAFDVFLQSAMDVVNQANTRIIESDIAQVEFATGQNNDMLTVILAQERAGSALNFTVQVTNRIIEAYREIMRMQV